MVKGLSVFRLSTSRSTLHALRFTPAFTMVEVLIVVAILALLVGVLLGVSSSLNTRKNTALTENCLVILDTALTEFHDITGHYPVDDWTADRTASLISDDRIAGLSGTPASDELLYLQLSILPQTREIIAKLPNQLIVSPLSGATVQLAGQSANTPYLRSIVDPWRTPLYYEVTGSFPLIRSSGPDGKSATVAEQADDITNEN